MNNKVIIKFSSYTYKIEFTGRITALHDPFLILAILLYCVDTIVFCIQSLISPVFISNCTNLTLAETHTVSS